jgi:hypothetical protein
VNGYLKNFIFEDLDTVRRIRIGRFWDVELFITPILWFGPFFFFGLYFLINLLNTRLTLAGRLAQAFFFTLAVEIATALHAFGVEQALTVDEPSYPAIAADELIESAAATYVSSDPDEVVNSLDGEASRLAQLADDAGTGAWSRGLTIGGARSDVRRMLGHALHDSLHHLDDVERGLIFLRT